MVLILQWLVMLFISMDHVVATSAGTLRGLTEPGGQGAQLQALRC
jgi:hypothetical protein